MSKDWNYEFGLHERHSTFRITRPREQSAYGRLVVSSSINARRAKAGLS